MDVAALRSCANMHSEGARQRNLYLGSMYARDLKGRLGAEIRRRLAEDGPRARNAALLCRQTNAERERGPLGWKHRRQHRDGGEPGSLMIAMLGSSPGEYRSTGTVTRGPIICHGQHWLNQRPNFLTRRVAALGPETHSSDINKPGIHNHPIYECGLHLSSRR
jgi:hypothetical protein